MRRTRAYVSLLLLAALPACRAATGPGGLAGMYQLVELDTQPLPYDHAQGCCIYTAGSLTLGASSYGVAITLQNKSNGMVATVNEEGTYTPNDGSPVFQRTSGTFRDASL